MSSHNSRSLSSYKDMETFIANSNSMRYMPYQRQNKWLPELLDIGFPTCHFEFPFLWYLPSLFQYSFISVIASKKNSPINPHPNLPYATFFSERLCPTNPPCHPLKTHSFCVHFFSPQQDGCLVNLAMILAQLLRLNNSFMEYLLQMALHFRQDPER